MYTVLLQNSRTMESFSKFHPLFMSLLNRNRIGVCKWIEGGTTIDSSAPGLLEMVNDKKEWRAVIVHMEDDEAMSAIEHSDVNPYDFALQSPFNMTEENPVPLIRLTQILGGVPKPEIQFEPQKIQIGANSFKMVYAPKKDEAAEAAYSLLSEKYRYDGPAPSSVILVAVRRNNREPEIHSKTDRRESESSDFWKRNGYPGLCRFTVFDYHHNGPVQRNADDFSFWTAVCLLASSETNPDILQAYRLYTLGVHFSGEKMADTFQEKVFRLKRARTSIHAELMNRERNPGEIDPVLPQYKHSVSINLKVPDKSGFKIGKKVFSILSHGINRDLTIWEKQKKDAERAFEREIVIMNRSLDRSADSIRGYSVFNDEEVSALNRYQREDMLKELDTIYTDLIELQGKIPEVDSISDNEELEEISTGIRAILKKRITKKAAFWAACTMVLLFLLADFWGMMGIAALGQGTWGELGIVLLIQFATTGLVSFLVLLYQKSKLARLVTRYNSIIDSIVNKFEHNSDAYSRYMSDIVSHSRGMSYLNLAARKTSSAKNQFSDQYRHMKAIDLFLSRLRIWGKAFYLNLDFSVSEPDPSYSVKTDSDPFTDTSYSFDDGKVYQVFINQSGAYVETELSFVDQLMITREELYNEH